MATAIAMGRVAGVIGLGLGLGLGLVGCRTQQQAVPEAAAPPPPAPAVPEPRPEPPPDAASDAGDAGGGHGHRSGPAGGGGGGSATDIKIPGGLPKGPAESLIRGRSRDLRACYEQARAGNPGLHGKVNFGLTIDNRGRVSLAEVVKSTLGGGDPEMCMVQALRSLKFPPPTGAGEPTITFQMKFGK